MFYICASLSDLVNICAYFREPVENLDMCFMYVMISVFL